MDTGVDVLVANNNRMLMGEVGCFLSHYTVWKKVNCYEVKIVRAMIRKRNLKSAAEVETNETCNCCYSGEFCTLCLLRYWKRIRKLF